MNQFCTQLVIQNGLVQHGVFAPIGVADLPGGLLTSLTLVTNQGVTGSVTTDGLGNDTLTVGLGDVTPNSVTANTVTASTFTVNGASILAGGPLGNVSIKTTNLSVTGSMVTASDASINGNLVASGYLHVAGAVLFYSSSVAINSVSYTWPSGNAGGVLTNDASGNLTWAAVGAGSLTGTTLASNVVTSSLTSVGTITTGTWNGTVVAIAYGGSNSTTTLTNNKLMSSQSGAIKELTTYLGNISTTLSGNTITQNGPAAVVGANPTASVGTSAVNGSATTFLRSDAAPAIDQTMSPTMTGVWTFTPAARSSGSAAYLTINAPADTALTAGAEAIGINLPGAIRQHTGGTSITLQREVVVGNPTYSFTSATTVATAISVEMSSPRSGTNATLTKSVALRLKASSSGVNGHRALVLQAAGTSGTGQILEVQDSNGNSSAGLNSSFAWTGSGGALTFVTVTNGVAFANGAGNLGANDANFKWDNVSHSLQLGGGNATIAATNGWREVVMGVNSSTVGATEDIFAVATNDPAAGLVFAFLVELAADAVTPSNGLVSLISSVLGASSNPMAIQASGLAINYAPGVRPSQTLDVNGNGNFVGSLAVGTTVTSYNGVATAGEGVPAIYGFGRATGQTAANTSVAAYTVGASDGSFLISANVNVTAATLCSFSVTCVYTDETNTSRSTTFTFTLVATQVTTITNATGTGAYEGAPQHIRAKAGTTITIKTTGTFTTVTYNVEGCITQIA